MSKAIEKLITLLDIENLEHNLFRGISPETGWQRVFGGQVIGQALVAAARTVEEDRTVHSLQAYFMRPGDPTTPIIYEVDPIRDGKSFSTRRVVAIQHGKAIYSMSASFQLVEEGLDHQAEMPDVPAPEDLMGEKQLAKHFLDVAPENVRTYWERERPIELRPTNFTRYISREKLPPVQNIWFRPTGVLPDDDRVHQCALAYASDMTLLDTALLPHGRAVFDDDLQVASLDHTMWFHRPFRFDDWFLYAQDTPNASGSRGLTRAQIFTRDGKLVASVAQEGLIRLRTH